MQYFLGGFNMTSKKSLFISFFLINMMCLVPNWLNANENDKKENLREHLNSHNAKQVKEANEDIKQKLRHVHELSSDENKLEKLKQFGSEQTIKKMERTFEKAPVVAKNIVDHLQNPNFYHNPYFRYAIFVGPPGSGKTTTAEFIAYKMIKEKDWEYVHIKSGELLSKTRNETAEKLRAILKTAKTKIASNKPVIIVIDELNELLENAENSHYDTSATAKYFWQFLDSNKEETNFFLIGTMNRDTHLPQPFKDRIWQNRIFFEGFKNFEEKREEFLYQLNNAHMYFENIDTNYIETVLQRLPAHMTGRKLEGFISLLKTIYRKYNRDSLQIIVSKQHFEETIEMYIKIHTEMRYDHVPETEEERQERHFVQRILMDNCMKLKMVTVTHGPRSTQEISAGNLVECEGFFSDYQKVLSTISKNNSEKTRADFNEKLEIARKNKSWIDLGKPVTFEFQGKKHTV